MAIDLLNSDYNQLVDILFPKDQFGTEQSRIGLVKDAFVGIPERNAIFGKLGGESISMHDDTAKIIRILKDFPTLSDGREALFVFLDFISYMFGEDKEKYFLTGLKDSYKPTTFKTGAPAPLDRPLSDLLYYKVDHVPQVDLVTRELAQVRSQANNLMLCVVQGSWNQAPDKLMERLKVEILPELLGMETLKPYSLAWPDPSTSLAELPAQFEMNLGKQVFGQAYTAGKTRLEIQDMISRQTTLVHTSVASDTFAQCGIEGLEKYLEFWDAWPHLAPTQRLFVYLFLELKPAEKQGLFSLFTRSPQEKLDRFLERIKAGPQKSARQVVLPPLSGAKKQHAINWVEREEVASRCEVGRVQYELSKYYQLPNGRDKETAPVLELVDNLKAWIAAFPRQSNGG